MALEMRLNLNAPGMTSLHKAGLAGLYMTLRAFDKKKEGIDGLEWTLEPQKVILRWMHKTPKAAFENLIRKSFSVDGGFVRFAGLEADREMSKEQKYHLSNALLHSFFQHGQHRSTEKKTSLPYKDDMDGKLCWIKEFTPIKKVKPYNEAVKEFIDEEGHFKNSIKAASWLYPGAGRRHGDNTKFAESAKTGLALMYAPVGVIFYRLRSRVKGRKARYAMVIPEIQDLNLYLEFRRTPTYRTFEMTASSSSDAALRFVTHLSGSDARKPLVQLSGNENIHCRVITFGIVNWSEQQKTRTFIHVVFSEKLKGLRNYLTATSIFQNEWQKSKEEKNRTGKVTKPESNFVSLSTAREFIADNIVQGRDWYHDLATFLGNKEARKGLSYERKEMHQMVKKAEFKSDTERLFIDVCQESWRRRMGKLSDRTGGESEYRRNLIQKEFDKLRISISRCRNAHTLRETIVDFWARAGRNEELQGDSVQTLLPLFDQDWRKARDLALLALISYQPKTREEAVLLINEPDEEGDFNE